MVKKVKRNKYKKWFFLLIFTNICYFGYYYVETPSVINHFRSLFNQVFYNPKIPSGNFIYGIDVSEYQGIISWDDVGSINGLNFYSKNFERNLIIDKIDLLLKEQINK